MTNLLDSLGLTAEECIDCGKCMSECSFLAENGSPASIALRAATTPEEIDRSAIKAYDCSMCGLCSAVCPVAARPADIFPGLRFHAQDKGLVDLKKYSPLTNYEKLGRKFPFKGNHIPQGCTTAFFPGCTFPALFPEALKNTYSTLKKNIPDIGLVLNCCSKPSKMLGLKAKHNDLISQTVREIESKGIKKLLTCCPNCHVTFKEYNPSFEVVSIYEELDRQRIQPCSPYLPEVTIHDPCVTRFEESIHDSIRSLLARAGVQIVEMDHHGKKTLCCGEGGAVGFHRLDLARTWSDKRIDEARKVNLPMATYCAGCVNYLKPEHLTVHVLDLLTVERDSLPRLPGFPHNYLNRLKLRLRPG